MIFNDPFYQTQEGEIFQASSCMQHEHAVVNIMTSMLRMHGYTTVRSDNRIWKKDDKTIVVCLTDDFGVCRQDWNQKNPAKWFEPNTIIFTDSWVPDDIFQTLPYQIHRLPTSYFGIFNYVPQEQEVIKPKKIILHPDAKTFQPKKRFNFSLTRLDSQEFRDQVTSAVTSEPDLTPRFHFSANRMDQERLHLVLEFIRQAGPLEKILKQDYINFNARDPNNPANTVDEMLISVDTIWSKLMHLHKDPEYKQCLDQLKNVLPLRNHKLTIEQAQVEAQLNLVFETYGGDVSVAFSEKIFRALVTPAPWTVFSARHSVQYLKILGFDVLDDLVDHSYDSNIHDDHKVRKYIESSRKSQEYLQTVDTNKIKQRCKQAAKYNQKILQQMQKSWPIDFARWLPGAIKKIQ